MMTVFVVQHLHRLPHGENDVKLIGVYETRKAAVESVTRLSVQPGFCDFPQIIDPEKNEDDQGFHMQEYELGRDNWIEGFITTP